MKENWADIFGYEGLYRVSTLGRVFAFNRVTLDGRRIGSRFRKPGVAGGGYLYVPLHKGGKAKNFYVARLVALAFIPNPLGKS